MQLHVSESYCVPMLAELLSGLVDHFSVAVNWSSTQQLTDKELCKYNTSQVGCPIP